MGIGVSMMLVGGGVATEDGGIIGGVPGITPLVSPNISSVVPDVVVITPNVVVVVGIVKETPLTPVSSKTERDVYYYDFFSLFFTYQTSEHGNISWLFCSWKLFRFPQRSLHSCLA